MSERVAPRVHAWRIEEREYARHEERRGRRHAFERIDPARTALVVVDMVPFFVEQNDFCRGIVPNIDRLAATLRTAGGAVAWVVPGPSPTKKLDEERLGPDVAQAYARSGGGGPLRERVWPELEVTDQDHNAALYTIYRSFGDVRTTDDLVGLIRAMSGSPRL